VAIQGRLSHAGPLDHLVDAHIADRAPGEELIGGVENALTRIRLRSRNGFEGGHALTTLR